MLSLNPTYNLRTQAEVEAVAGKLDIYSARWVARRLSTGEMVQISPRDAGNPETFIYVRPIPKLREKYQKAHQLYRRGLWLSRQGLKGEGLRTAWEQAGIPEELGRLVLSHLYHGPRPAKRLPGDKNRPFSEAVMFDLLRVRHRCQLYMQGRVLKPGQKARIDEITYRYQHDALEAFDDNAGWIHIRTSAAPEVNIEDEDITFARGQMSTEE